MLRTFSAPPITTSLNFTYATESINNRVSAGWIKEVYRRLSREDENIRLRLCAGEVVVIVPEVFDPNEKAEREIVDLAAAV